VSQSRLKKETTMAEKNDINEKAAKALTDVLDITRRLRAPDGCPWDREQTPDSIKKYIKEETYELIDAIDAKSPDDICEELGDLIFLLAFLSVLFEEKSLFTIADSMLNACRKMIRRHPHIFGDTRVEGTKDVVANWQKIKKKEAESKGKRHSVLGNLPKAMPALQRAYRLGERASRVGFDWEETSDIITKLEEEVNEIRKALQGNCKESVEEEMGDILFTICNISRHIGINPEDALNISNKKFVSRFHKMEEQLEKAGTSPSEADSETMNRIWNEIKGLK
jgi:tetrapyrrole methylase family protein/MazG family protein/ATP diphosphatase